MHYIWPEHGAFACGRPVPDGIPLHYGAVAASCKWCIRFANGRQNVTPPVDMGGLVAIPDLYYDEADKRWRQARGRDEVHIRTVYRSPNQRP